MARVDLDIRECVGIVGRLVTNRVRVGLKEVGKE